jgi:hypothetical protein
MRWRYSISKSRLKGEEPSNILISANTLGVIARPRVLFLFDFTVDFVPVGCIGTGINL